MESEMPNYSSPGVYIEEVSAGARPVEAVGTSTAGFVGTAPDAAAFHNKAEAVNNWTEFVKKFAPSGRASTHLAQAVFGFFLNGGRRCYVVNVGSEGSIAGDGRGRNGIDLLEEIDEVAIVAAPGFSDAASFDALLSHCEKLKDRVAILDAPAYVSQIDLLTKVAAVSAPQKARGETEGDKPSEPSGATGARPRQSDGGYGAVYFPWIVVRDALSAKEFIQVPPSGHLAGIYARTDATRGVHKAPANEIVRGALDLTYRVTHDEQGELNQNGVNVIRFFSSEGIRVWGARTVAPSSSEWRYLNVRRLFNMVEESIARGTRWVVFEPNHMPLWKAIRRDVSAFLTMLWRQGALMGQTPEEAFFVKCDEETNPSDTVNAGMLVAVIGLAPVKPAEFVVFRISQSAGGAQIDSTGGEQGGGNA
jgi:phage tail sheath protein FI